MPVFQISYIKNRFYVFWKSLYARPTIQVDTFIWTKPGSHSPSKLTWALHYLIFGSTSIFSFQGASYNQDRFNSTEPPVIMILKIKTQAYFLKDFMIEKHSHSRSKSRKPGIQINPCLNEVKQDFPSPLWNCANHVPPVPSCFSHLILSANPCNPQHLPKTPSTSPALLSGNLLSQELTHFHVVAAIHSHIPRAMHCQPCWAALPGPNYPSSSSHGCWNPDART